MNKDVTQGQEFFESHYFSYQNWPKSEFNTYRYKTSARDYFLENKASLMIFSHFKARLNFLSDPFCLNWRKLILKVFDFVRKFCLALKWLKSLEKPCFPKNICGLRFYGDRCEIQVEVHFDMKNNAIQKNLVLGKYLWLWSYWIKWERIFNPLT